MRLFCPHVTNTLVFHFVFLFVFELVELGHIQNDVVVIQCVTPVVLASFESFIIPRKPYVEVGE